MNLPNTCNFAIYESIEINHSDLCPNGNFVTIRPYRKDIAMKRKIYDTLLKWKRTGNGKSTIVLDGACRVGKSYIAEGFARNEYAAYLIVDFTTATKKVKGYMEIDFLLAKSRTQPRGNVSPVEVKSGRKYGTASLNKFRVKYADFLDTPFVLHNKDVKVENGVTYLPLYMAPLLVRRDRITQSMT